jgi:STE24 endopeptidase
VFVYDGSKQSDRYTANVSGIGGTARIAMSDAMLKRATLEEVRAVVGHEIGHYRHTHAFWLAGGFGLVLAIAFWLTGRVFPFFQTLLGANRVNGLADPAGLPVFMAALGAISLLSTPFTNSIVRLAEEDADRYSLEHAREPDGLASALVKTIEYRASSPSVVEEVLFYDHPSVENRVRRAMEWRTANAPVAEPVAAPAAPAAAVAEPPPAAPATPTTGG